MPLYKLLAEPDKASFAIWKTDENIEALKNMLSKKSTSYKIPEGFKHERRISEWIVVRLLLHELLLTHEPIWIDYDENGKPQLQSHEGNISISHTGNFVGVLYHKKLKTGIDIERLSPRIEKIVHKFLNEQELKFISGNHRLEKLYIIWGAKESMFKWYSKGSINFRKNFNVLPFEYNEKGEINAQFILNKDICPMTLHYHNFDNLMMVYVINK